MPKVKFSAVLVALLLMACGGGTPAQPEPVEPQPGEGVVQLPLTSTSEGVTYRLVGASFVITGPKSVTISETTPDTVSVTLPSGAYSIRLDGEWHLERTDAPGQAVQATLLSPNPMTFSLYEGQTREVQFIFKTAASATANVGISVDSGGWISGTVDFNLVEGTSTPNPFDEVLGRSVPFILSFKTATLTRVAGAPALFVQTGPVTVQFGGAYSRIIHDRATTSLQGAQLSFSLMTFSNNGEIGFSGFELAGTRGETFRLALSPGGSFPGAKDADGYPVPQEFRFTGSTLSLNLDASSTTRYRASGPALGTGSPQ